MSKWVHFQEHLEKISKTVYVEPELSYHEKMIDSAFGHFVKTGSFTNVLDVGVGTGYTLGKFKEAGIPTIGITLDEKEQEVALLRGYDVRIMDMAFLEFDDETFDLIWCRHALEHSVMPYIALLEFSRVLLPGGYLYIEVPADNIIHLENINHYSLLSDGLWQALFRKTGFRLYFRSQFAMTVTGNEYSDGYHDIYWQYWLKKDNAE